MCGSVPADACVPLGNAGEDIEAKVWTPQAAGRLRDMLSTCELPDAASEWTVVRNATMGPRTVTGRAT